MPIGYTERPAGVVDRAYRLIAKAGSKLSPSNARELEPKALEGFRQAQRLAYQCVVDVGQQLKVGQSEIEVSAMLAERLKELGTERFLHRPFAWFANHARFDEYVGYGDYHPTERKLKKNDSVILDVSPMVNGFIADVGYSCCLGENSELERAQKFLRKLRGELPALFDVASNPAEVWRLVDQRVKDAGFDNVHSKYPFAVLGHRVFKLKTQAQPAKRVGGGWVGWFSTEANLKMISAGFGAILSPENIGSKKGIWAIEPHIGWSDGGAKFEELLVVDEAGARWLDDEVPHLKA